MTNKPQSADELLVYLYLNSTRPEINVTAEAKLPAIAKAKRHLAEAIEQIIDNDDYPNFMIGSAGQARNYIRNELRAEQRKRLAEWLGGKDE